MIRVILAMLVVAGLVTAVWTWGQEFMSSGPVARGPDKVAAGRPLYQAHCTRCHGSALEGERAAYDRPPEANPAPAHDDSGDTWHRTDKEILRIIRQGTQRMPAYADTLDRSERRAVVAYIKSAWTRAQYLEQFVETRSATRETLDAAAE